MLVSIIAFFYEFYKMAQIILLLAMSSFSSVIKILSGFALGFKHFSKLNCCYKRTKIF